MQEKENDLPNANQNIPTLPPHEAKIKWKYILVGSILVVIFFAFFLSKSSTTLPASRQSQSSGTPSPSKPSLIPSPQQRSSSKNHWILAESAAIDLNKTSLGSAFITALDTSSTYEIINLHTNAPDPLPQATHIEGFQSYQLMQSAFENSQIPSNVKVIMYDNEHWAGTPINEQQQPFIYVPMAETLVHQHGLLFMNTPAADLRRVLDPQAKDQYSAYLEKKLATLAKYTDIFEIQAQNAPSVAEYISFAQQAITQAKAANSRAVILLGITAKTTGPTSQELLQEVKGTYTITDGYWFNIIGGSSGVAIALPVIQALPSLQ